MAPSNVVNGTPNVANIPEENPTNENQNKENKKTNKKNKNTPILYNAESEEIVYRNIQNLSPNNLYNETTRVFQNNTNKTRYRHQRRKNKGRKTRKTRIRK